MSPTKNCETTTAASNGAVAELADRNSGQNVSSPSTACVKSEPPHHLHQRPMSPTVRINLGPIDRRTEMSSANDDGTNKPCLVERAKDTAKPVRKWRAHLGRNRFFCDGRFVMARQGSIFLLTLFLIVFTMALFCVFDLPYLTEKVSVVIPITASALFLLVLSSLLRTALSDPGIIPRASPREVLEWERQHQESDPFFHQDEWAQPRTRIVNIRGQPVKLKYCFTCCIFRPPRSSHCSICDNCVQNFDHHCPWLGNCIGLRNYRHFYLFITTLSLLDAFMGFFVGIHLYKLSQDKGTFLEAVKESPPSMLTGLINVVSIWSVLGLSGFHTYLLALGQTTNEDIKGTFNRKLHPQVKNPYSSGNCITNILSTICSPEKPSPLDRRGWLIPDEESAIFVDAELLNKLWARRRISGHQHFGLIPQRGGNNSSAPSLVAVGGERRKRDSRNNTPKGGVSSCPSSPPRQRRSNSARMRELFRQSENDENHQVAISGRHFASSRDKNHQNKTRICHSSNLIVPIEQRISPSSEPTERTNTMKVKSAEA